MSFEAPPAQALIDVHARLIAIHGGPGGVRDPGALDAALARPFNLLACSAEPVALARFAVAIAYSICRIRHPFADGNKRVAFAALVGVLDMNGLALDVAEGHAAEVVTAVAAGTMSEEELVAWVGLNTYPIGAAG